MTNLDIANNLKVIANFYNEVKGDLGRMYAYEKAADSVKVLPYKLTKQKLFREHIPYVGDSIREKIYLMLVGKFNMLEYFPKNNLPEQETKTKKFVASKAIERVKPLLLSIPNTPFYICGSFRRNKKLVKDIDILIVGSKFPKFNFEKLKVLQLGESKISVIVNRIQVDFRLTSKKSLACALLHFTGSKEFNIRMRQMALVKGYKLNEYCIEDLTIGTKIYPKTEEDIFKFFDMPYIKPENRL